MQPVYRVTPTVRCQYPSTTFPDALAALEHGRRAADAYRVGYCVYRSLAGRLLHLWTFPALARRA